MENKQYYPKILVISINALSSNGSNGRVLDELLCQWPSNSIAQLYITNESPNSAVCKNFFRITDKDALKSCFLRFGKTGKQTVNMSSQRNTSSAHTKRKIKKNPLLCLTRDLIWKFAHWDSRALKKWIAEFNPDIILMQAGFSSFLPRIVLKLSKEYNIPFIIYNTENYYFKDFNYFFNSGFGLFFPLYRRECVKMFKKMMKKSSCEIYTNDLLKELYDKEFGKKSYLIYQSTGLQPFQAKANTVCSKFTYAGNLGIGRAESLVEIGRALNSISSDYVLDIYGSAPSDEIEHILRNSVGILYHGRIPYEDLLKVMESSDLLFHTESFVPWRIKDLQTAFSTKIADSLASGRCLVLYADTSLACTRYLTQNDCACVITDKDSLADKLKEIISSPDLRNYYTNRAIDIVAKNHNSSKNSEMFKNVVSEVLDSHNESYSN